LRRHKAAGRPGAQRAAAVHDLCLSGGLKCFAWPHGSAKPQSPMPTAIILLKIAPAKITGTAAKLLDIRAVTDVYSISGRYDLLVIIKCDSIEMIESVITDHLLKTEGIVGSETMFAFRSYDKREGGKAIDVD